MQDAAQILFRTARLRAVVVGQVKVGDAVVKGREAELLHGFVVAGIAKVVPEAQRHSGQQQTAFAAAVVRHGRIARIGCLIHKNFSFILFCWFAGFILARAADRFHVEL